MPPVPAFTTEQILLRILARVREDPVSGCWNWQGWKNGKGKYGAIRTRGKNVYVHRWLYELVHGEVPLGLELDHLCRNKACVRVEHLEAVTHAENVRRALLTEHCKEGHAWAEHAIVFSTGRRVCRICKSKADREYWARRKAASVR